MSQNPTKRDSDPAITQSLFEAAQRVNRYHAEKSEMRLAAARIAPTAPGLTPGRKSPLDVAKRSGLAEAVRFELTEGLSPRRFSRPVP